MKGLLGQVWGRLPLRRIDVVGGYLWEGTEMKGMKPGSKPDKGKGSEQVDQLLRVIDTQSRVIEALAQAVMATADAGGEEGEEDENEDEDKDKNEE